MPQQKRVFIDLTKEPHLEDKGNPIIVVQGSDSDEEDIPEHMTVAKAKTKLNDEVRRAQLIQETVKGHRNSPDYERLKIMCPEIMVKYNHYHDEIERKCIDFIELFREFERYISQPQCSDVVKKNQILSGHVIGFQSNKLDVDIEGIEKKIQGLKNEVGGFQQMYEQLLKQQP